MRITYCRRWNEILGKPIQPLTEAQARQRDRAKQWYTVVLGDIANPDCYLEVAWENDHVGVWFLDDHGRQVLHYSFRRVDENRMFLRSITRWEYPEGAPRGLDEATFIEEFTYEQDGTVRREVDDARANEISAEHYSDVPLDINWEPVPKFGDYRSVTRLDRETEVVSQGLNSPPGDG